MRILISIIILPLVVLAQTEFHISTAGPPLFNECKVIKDSLPIKPSLSTSIDLIAFVWNPDSIEWCTTKEGYYRSRDNSHPPVWKIDDVILSQDNGFALQIPVLDTLEHVVTATYLQFPTASVRYKGTNNTLPFLIYSKNHPIFLSDSIHIFIETVFPTTFIDSSIPTILASDVNENVAIMTFDTPSDTSIKLTSVSCNNQIQDCIDFKETYSPSLNSYSIIIPFYIEYIGVDMQYDTVFAIFKNQSDYDTLEVLFLIPTRPSRAISHDVEFQIIDINSTGRIYDIKGRLIGKLPACQTNSNVKTLSNGVYLLQFENGKSPVVKKGIRIK